MKNNIIIALMAFLALGTTFLQAQQVEELKKELTEVTTRIEADTKKVADLQGQIDRMVNMGWKFGGAGAVTFNLAGFNNWSVGDPQLDNMTILSNLSLFANRNEDKFFWNNGANLKVGYQKYEETDWINNVDELFISSLFGYKITDKLAASVLADYRSTFASFNDPGYLSIGAGVTWTPIQNLTVIFHPLTMQGVFVSTDAKKAAYGIALDKSSAFTLGAKLAADYTRANFLLPGLTYNGHFEAFRPYGSTDITGTDGVVTSENLMQWTMNNNFGYQLNKYIGLTAGVDFRSYKPEYDGIQSRYIFGAGISTTF